MATDRLPRCEGSDLPGILAGPGCMQCPICGLVMLPMPDAGSDGVLPDHTRERQEGRCAGPESHNWGLTLEEGRGWLESGCPDCDDSVDERDIYMGDPSSGRLTRKVLCPNARHTGPELCPDCVEHWQFTPAPEAEHPDTEDMGWLLGHLARCADPGLLIPPRLGELLVTCVEGYDPSRYTVATPLARIVPGREVEVDE